MNDQGTTLTSATAIMSTIQQLIQGRELMNAVFDHGRASIMTLLLDADRDRGVLVFDASGDPAMNARITATDNVIFTGALRGTKIRFATGAVKSMAYRGMPALATRLPAQLSTLQNRSAYRVKVSRLYCSIPIPGIGIERVPVLDLSVGGVMLQLPGAADRFSMGDRIAGCNLELGTHGKIACTLEVRRIKRTPGRGLTMGCKLIGIGRTNEAAIARFVAQEERKRIL